MCGIAGFVNTSGTSCDKALLHRMLGVLRHRGPDAIGIRLDQTAGLSHARLSIIDLAGGAQPMCNEDGSLWIVFNGEIFNYLELREELLARGHRFATRSDTEVILHLFEDCGEGCVARLNGQWAFAIWDSERHRLFLSRDRLGVRPLYYCPTPRAFLFASEIKALMQHPEVPREPDLKALDEIFTFWHTLPPRTAFRGIFELPPGRSATLAGADLAVRQYWDLTYDPATGCNGREEEYGEELLAILKDAVRLRLRSDVPVGAYLSGGLDSTLIAALIGQNGAARLNTFSVRFEDDELDEGPYQAEAVRHLDVAHQEIRASANEIGRVFPQVIWHAETPLVRTAPAPLFLLSSLVRNNNYKVVLTGEGSDEMLGGYDIFKEVKIRAFWARQPSSKLRPLLLRRLYPYMPRMQAQPPAYLQAFFHVRPEDAESPFFSHLPRWRLTSKLKSYFSAEVKAELAAYDPLETMESFVPPDYRAWDPFTRAQYLEARGLLPGYILSSQGDRMAMAHSVEGRFPFLDHRLAEFASRLPAHLKMRGLKEKYLLKRIANGLVPPAIANRPKQPYRAPDAASLFSPAAREYTDALLDPARVRRDGMFDPTAVQWLAEKARKGSAVSVAENMAIAGIVSTQILIEKFITHFTPEALRWSPSHVPAPLHLHKAPRHAG